MQLFESSYCCVLHMRPAGHATASMKATALLDAQASAFAGSLYCSFLCLSVQRKLAEPTVEATTQSTQRHTQAIQHTHVHTLQQRQGEACRRTTCHQRTPQLTPSNSTRRWHQSAALRLSLMRPFTITQHCDARQACRLCYWACPAAYVRTTAKRSIECSIVGTLPRVQQHQRDA